MNVLVGIVIGLVALWVALLVLFYVLRPKDVTVRELLAVVPDVLRLLRSLVRDGTVPVDVRLVLVALICWILSPIDLIRSSSPCSARSTTSWSPSWRCATCADASGSRIFVPDGRERPTASPC